MTARIIVVFQAQGEMSDVDIMLKGYRDGGIDDPEILDMVEMVKEGIHSLKRSSSSGRKKYQIKACDIIFLPIISNKDWDVPPSSRLEVFSGKKKEVVNIHYFHFSYLFVFSSLIQLRRISCMSLIFGMLF